MNGVVMTTITNIPLQMLNLIDSLLMMTDHKTAVHRELEKVGTMNFY